MRCVFFLFCFSSSAEMVRVDCRVGNGVAMVVMVVAVCRFTPCASQSASQRAATMKLEVALFMFIYYFHSISIRAFVINSIEKYLNVIGKTAACMLHASGYVVCALCISEVVDNHDMLANAQKGQCVNCKYCLRPANGPRAQRARQMSEQHKMCDLNEINGI